jgi:molecular chaperone GrpE
MKYKKEKHNKKEEVTSNAEVLEESTFNANEEIDNKKSKTNSPSLHDKEVNEKSLEETLQDEISQLRDEKLRLLAEMDNLRKRSDKERIDYLKYGSINLARDILSPDDNLTRALEAIPQEDKTSKTILNLVDGLKMVQKEFSTILKKHGVKKISALNCKFDHNFHQAMIEIENDKVEEGLVIQEIQSGYTMHDRLLRPSMVGVSKKSSKSINKEKD